MAEIEDREYDPSIEPESSRVWLNLLEDAQKKFRDYHDKADRIDKVYANLHRQAGSGRDREFAIFWANIQVILPSIYAKPPVPVVTPKFQSRKKELTTAGEFLERACSTAFDLAHIDDVLRLVRDDLAIVGRGVAWVRYEQEDGQDKVCIEYLDRKDFIHDPARHWCEVKWVARRAYMTFDEMQERFASTSGDAYKRAAYEVRRKNWPDAGVDPRQQAEVWEIWHKGENRVVWVTEGVDVVLDSAQPPHLKLDNFFPCPKPAYSTVERGSLVPVPDVLYYDDQLQEIDKLTARIHALGDAVQVKGFYPAGGDIGDAVEQALSIADDRKVMIPVSNFAAFGQSGSSPIVWMPLDLIAETIRGLIEMRRQLIDDVYQIVGLADIVRGASEAEETLGAQQIKRESTSVRVRSKVHELVRFGRDLLRITAEIMAEHFDEEQLVEMSQMDLPRKADLEKQVKALEKAAEQALRDLKAQVEQIVQQNPAQAQQMLEQGQQQIISQFQPQLEQLRSQVPVEAVMEILRDQKLRPFLLDIETDSTIYQDELTEKQARAEFLQAFSNAAAATQPLIQAGQAGAKLAGLMLKFALAPYRVGRELDAAIEEFIEQAPAALAQQQDNELEQGLVQAQLELAKAEMAKVQSQTEANQANAALKMQELELKAAEAQEKPRQAEQQFALAVQEQEGKIAETAARIRKIEAEIEAMSVKAEVDLRKADVDEFRAVSDAAAKQTDQAMQAANAERDAVLGANQMKGT